MESSAYRSLAFLFSFGTLPIACSPKGGDTTDGTGGTDGTTNPTDGATDGTSTPTTSTTTTTGEPTTGGASETGGANPACAAYVAYYLKCFPESGSEAEMYAYCTMMLTRVGAIFGPTCLAVYEAVYECLGSSPCETDVCEAEFAAAEQCYPEANDGCVAFAAKQEECYGMPLPSYAAGMCQYYINARTYYDGPPCGSAFEEWYACLLDLPCPEFEMQTGCDAQKAAVDLACENP